MRGALSVNIVFNQIVDPNQLKGQLNYDQLLPDGTTASSDANAKRIYYYNCFGAYVSWK